jgi:hypothetical protein
MRPFWFSAYAAIIASTLIGCAGGQPLQPFSGSTELSVAEPVAHHPSSQSYSTNNTLLFEADSGFNDVEIYRMDALKRDRAPVATITDAIFCPMAMGLDHAGTLYVANSCGSPTEVTEYPKGQTTHSVAITDGINYPEGLTIDKAGTLYVTSYSPAAIVEYAYGTTTPSQTITGGGLSNPYGLALDKEQNLYVADNGAQQVFEIPHGTTSVKALNLQDLHNPLAVAVDKSSNLWVTANGYGSGTGYVNIYPPGSTTPSTTLTDFGLPYGISIDRQGTAAVTNLNPVGVYVYKRGQYAPYATLTKYVSEPTGVLLGKP